MTGFFEMLMRSADRLIDASCCLLLSSLAAMVAALGCVGRVLETGMGLDRTPPVTSFGRSTRTGPGLPVMAISNASLMRLGSSAVSLTKTFHFVQALVMPM